MTKLLPAVGSIALLEALHRGGRRFRFSAAQLWRVHLLAALTSCRSFNAVQRSLIEQRPLRRFAHLPNERSVPDVRMLHEFRLRLGVGGFRSINDHLVEQVLMAAPLRDKTVGLFDATDLPASTRDKKRRPALDCPQSRFGSTLIKAGSYTLFRRL